MTVRQLRNGVVKKLILAGDPHAFDEDTLLGRLARQEARIANDPVIQQRRAEVRAERHKELLPIRLIGLPFNAVLCGAAAWFAPGLVSPAMAVVACVLTTALLWKITSA